MSVTFYAKIVKAAGANLLSKRPSDDALTAFPFRVYDLFSPVAEQKVEIQEERKTSFTIVPQTGKAQLTAVNRDQKQSIYASVNKAQIMEQERVKFFLFSSLISKFFENCQNFL